jgi:hypothetical protein
VAGDDVVVAGDAEAAASVDGEASGAGVFSVVGATEGDAEAVASLLFAPCAGLDSSLVAGGVLIGVTGVAGRVLVLRYQMSAVKPRRIDAASSRTRARGLKAIEECLPKILRELKKRTGDKQHMPAACAKQARG